VSDELDLEAIQAAEAEAAGEGYKFKWGTDRFELPAVLPQSYLFEASRVGLNVALTNLLGDDAEKLWAHKPGRKAIEALDQGIAKHYGFGKWEKSSASAEPSRNGSGPSRPTSSATTA
jgi:hypothetical protein